MDWGFYIVQGSLITLKYSIIPLILGLILGALVALLRISKICALVLIARCYISIIRGTPVLLQLSIIYFPFDISVSVAGIMAFSLNSSAYIAEIIRAGINSVDRGQKDACKTLGIPYYLMMKDIVLPQAIRNIIPALANESVALVKESAIIGMIGELDLMRRANIVASEQYSYFEPLIAAGCCYYIITLILSCIAGKLEEKMKC